MKRCSIGLLWLFAVLLSTPAWGQGFLISPDRPGRLPRCCFPTPTPPPDQYRVKDLSVNAKLIDQVAQVQVSQTFVNTGSRQMEVQFVFPLPYDGAIDSLTLLVDGKEFPAQLLPADQARQKYEAIVRSAKDPALLEWMGNGLFQTSVFPVPVGAERTVTLTYNQILRKDFGATEFLFPLSPAKFTDSPIDTVSVKVNIESSLEIGNVYSPTHDVQVTRNGKRNASANVELKNFVPSSDLRLFYDVDAEEIGTTLFSYRPNSGEDGYFMLLTTPQIPEETEPIPKTVLFVIDKSGSMTGEKIDQAKEALRFVVNNLNEGDLFNILDYNSSVDQFRPELEIYNDETRKAALGYIDGIYAGSGTNIHDALTTGLAQLQDSDRPNFVLFLTDGLPTVGEVNESNIAAAVRQSNNVRARMLSFGVGYDVNSRLLDRLTTENSGASEYVRPDEDIETYVSRVYRRIAAPVMTNVEVVFRYDQLNGEDGYPINRVYPSGEIDLFAGEQIVMVGRYRKPGDVRVVVRGKVQGELKRYRSPGELIASSTNQNFAFVEKLWAIRRIGEIIDEIDLNGDNEELTRELVLLSTKHGILTPYTSFLADENVTPTTSFESGAFLSNSVRSASELEQLEQADGLGGVAQRSNKQMFREARSAAAPAFGGGSGGGSAAFRDAATDEDVVVDSVRNSGNQALYRRGTITVTPETAELDLESDQDKIEVIERFSPEYFALVSANTAEENRLLSSQRPEEQLLLQFRGQNYLIK